MKVHKDIQYCLQEIEEKLNWGDSTQWVESDFVNLSKLISNKTEILISPHTLKRLYGKIKYKQHYDPQKATKEALVKFLDYNDWNAFSKHCEDSYVEEVKPAVDQKAPIWKRKVIKIGFYLLGVVAFVFLIIQWTGTSKTSQANDNDSTFSFIISDSVGTVPYTISAKYDIKNLLSDSIYLDLGFIHPVTGPDIKKLDKQRSLYNFTYQIPGYYKIKLNNQGQEIATKNILATSEDWNSYFYSEGIQHLWLDTQIKTSRENGALYYSPKTLSHLKFNTKSVYYIDHRLFKDFGIDGDNFEMNLRFKNSNETGGTTCYDFVLTLFGKNDYAHFKLMETRCSSYSGIKVGQLDLNGVDEDLSNFTFDPNRWNNLYVIVKRT